VFLFPIIPREEQRDECLSHQAAIIALYLNAPQSAAPGIHSRRGAVIGFGAGRPIKAGDGGGGVVQLRPPAVCFYDDGWNPGSVSKLSNRHGERASLSPPGGVPSDPLGADVEELRHSWRPTKKRFR